MELDKEQQKVVQYTESTICIAGPGSGKTRVLTEKAAKLVQQHGDVICLTFTRSAAREIRSRIPGIPAGTIHSFCHGQVGWNAEMEYEGLLTNFLKVGGDKFEWVLVDEVQDLTSTQMQVVLSIVGKYFFAVGDPYQSIYGYGGALGMDAISILKERRGRVFDLRNNYRSQPQVVRQLNRIYDRRLVSAGVQQNGLVFILARTNEEVRALSDILKEEGIGHTVRSGANDLSPKKEVWYGSKRIIVSTIHMSKGLEADYVFLFNWYPGRTSIENRNLYYVANSRASLEFLEPSSREELVSLMKAVVPELDQERYTPKKESVKDVPHLHSVIIQPEWFKALEPWLVKATKVADRKTSSTAKTALGRLRLGRRFFDEGKWHQVTLSEKELRLVAALARDMHMPEIYEELSVGLDKEKL